jgi:hypothetical protein
VRNFRLFALIIAFPLLSRGQVFQVNGGSSSLYQAQGGSVTVHGSSYDATIGTGLVAGHFVGGANLTWMTGKSTWILGDDYIQFILPTDIFDGSDYLTAIGAGVKTKVRGTDVFAFAGATSTLFDSPLFQGAQAEDPAGILFLKRQITRHWQASSSMVFSRQFTAIQSLAWQPQKDLKLALSGGVGANQPYGAGSFDYRRSWIDAKAAYIAAGSQFHRVIVETPLMSEPDRENVVVTVRPAGFLSFSGGRNNYLTPLSYATPASNTQDNVRTTADQGSGSLQIEGASLSGTFYHSTFQGSWNNSTAYNAERSFFGRFNTTTSYLESRPNDAPKIRAFLSNITEKVTPRIDVSELVSHSHGQTTVSFGGGFLSNVASVTAEYQTYYVPERNSAPFEQALIIDLQLHLLHGVSLHGSTFVAPDGSLRYTIDSQAIAVRQGTYAPDTPDNSLVRASIGSMLLRGRVLDSAGHPVAGAALMIDQLLVYSDDDGFYYIRERKPHDHQLRVMVNQFLGGGAYRVVSAPAIVRSSYDTNSPEIVVIVERINQAEK